MITGIVIGSVGTFCLHIYKPAIFNVGRELVLKGIARVKAFASSTPTPPAQ